MHMTRDLVRMAVSAGPLAALCSGHRPPGAVTAQGGCRRSSARDTRPIRSMRQASPYRSQDVVVPRPDQHQRPRDRRRRRRSRRSAPHLRRLRDERRLEDRRRRRDVAGDFRRTCRRRASATSPSRRRIPTSSGSAPARRTSSARRWRAWASTSRPTRARRSSTWASTDTQTIARILVHPTNSDIVYVAASGHEWTDNEMRGVFKTTNGGKTWTRSITRAPAPAPSTW